MYRILYRFLTTLARLAVRSGRSKDIEIIVLRHQLRVLHRQHNRPSLNDDDRSLLAAIAQALPRHRRHGWLVTPDTLLRWHRRRIAKHWTQPPPKPGRPPTQAKIRRLIIQMSADNPTWGYRRIHGEATNLGHNVGASTVWRILKDHGIEPSAHRSSVTWSQFLKSQAAIACDFAPIDTAFLRRYYLLFFIDITNREVFFALCPFQRQLMCTRVRVEGWRVADAATAAGCSQRTCHKWLARFDAGEPMIDRSSRPHSSPNQTSAEIEEVIKTLRRLRMTGPQIAEKLQMPLSTVTSVLKRIGLNRLSKLEPPEPPDRYCRQHPGELIHIDIKKLGRFNKPGHRVTGRGPGNYNHQVGWEAVHVCIDDTSRVAYVEVLPDQKTATCIGFLDRAIAWFAAHGITIERVMTDNGSAYVSKTWAEHCARIEIRHIRTRPYRPRTNGKAERFIQTMLREWAYAAVYQTSDQRSEALGPWLWRYNNQRLHSALGHKTPISRLHHEDND